MKRCRSKKGVTLVELIAVIAILGVISTIGFTIYGSTKKKILEKDYNNLVSFIETKAEKYASDTGIKNVNVETLIKEGYIDADDKNGYLYNPVTKKPLNCYVIKNDLKGSDFLATFDSSKPYVESNSLESTCKKVAIEKAYIIYVNDEELKKDTDNNGWYNKKDFNKNGGLKLTIKENNGSGWVDLKSGGYNFHWYNKRGLDIPSTNNSYTINSEGIHEYSVEVKNGNEILGVAETIVKLDNNDPRGSIISNSTDYSKTIKGTLNANDGKFGSGIKEIFLGNTKINNLGDNKYDIKKANIEINKPKVELKIEDYAGNKYTELFTFSNIDNNLDSVNLDVEVPDGGDFDENKWYQKLILHGTAVDNKSGIDSSDFYKDNAKYNIENNDILLNIKEEKRINITENGKWQFKATDILGNLGESNFKEIKNIDKIKPTIDSIDKKYYNNHKNAKLEVKASDIEDDKGIASGISSVQLKTKSNSYNKIITADGNINKSYIFDNITENVPYYLTVKDKANNEITETIEFNFDSVRPTVTLTHDPITKKDYNNNVVRYYNEVNLKGTAIDDIGVIKYAFTETKNPPTNGTPVENNNSNEKFNISKIVKKNGTYYFWACDSIGCSNTKTTVENIDSGLDKPTLSGNDVYSNSITITGTAHDDNAIIEYAFTTSSRTPYYRDWQKVNDVTPDDISVDRVVNSKGTYYFWVKDVAGNIQKSDPLKITKIDNRKPTATVSENPSRGWTKSAVLTGSGNDYESEIDEYAFTVSNVEPNNNGWQNYNSNVLPTLTITSNGKYYFWVKDKAGNIGYDYINVTNIDNQAPIYSSGGKNISKNKCDSISIDDAATFSDNLSGVKNVYYLLTNDSSTPSIDKFKSTNRTFYSGITCNNRYYLWAMAVDYANNNSNIEYLGNVYSCDEGNWTNGTCSYDGWQTNTRYNGCSKTKEEQTIPCKYIYKYDPWGECQSNNKQYRTYYYRKGGIEYSSEEETSCVYVDNTNTDQNVCVEDSICSNEQWSYAMISNKEKWHTVNTVSRNILHSCNVCLADNYCPNARFKSDGYWYVSYNEVGMSGEAKVNMVGDLGAFCEPGRYS